MWPWQNEGVKRKRAEPEIVRFFTSLDKGGTGGDFEEDTKFNDNDEIRLIADILRAMGAVAENKDGTANNSKEAIALFGKMLEEDGAGKSECAPIITAATDALGKNCSSDALTILIRACSGKQQAKSVRLAALGGLERMACGPDQDIRVKRVRSYRSWPKRMRTLKCKRDSKGAQQFSCGKEVAKLSGFKSQRVLRAHRGRTTGSGYGFASLHHENINLNFMATPLQL